MLPNKIMTPSPPNPFLRVRQALRCAAYGAASVAAASPAAAARVTASAAASSTRAATAEAVRSAAPRARPARRRSLCFSSCFLHDRLCLSNDSTGWKLREGGREGKRKRKVGVQR